MRTTTGRPVPWWARVTSQTAAPASATSNSADQRRGDPRAPHPKRHTPPGVRRQRTDHRGDLARGAARPRGLDGQHILEIGDQLGVVAVAVLLVLGRGAIDDRGQSGRHLGPLDLHVGERLADVLHGHRDLVLALEGNLAGEHLVEHDAHGIEVGLAGHVVAECLFG